MRRQRDIGAFKTSFVVRMGEQTDDRLTAQSTAMRILEEHVSSSAQLYDTICKMSLQMLRGLPGAEYVETSYRAPRHRLVEECKTATVDLIHVKNAGFSNQDSIGETGRSSSQWEIPIRFEGKEKLETFGIRFSVAWQKDVKGSGHDLHPLQSKGDYAWSSLSADNSERARNGLKPLLDLQFRLAKWIQGKVHASYEALGLEYAFFASDVFEWKFGPGRATLFAIRIGDPRPEANILVDDLPHQRFSYSYSAFQINRLRSAIKKGDLASSTCRALIALGSNVGNRISMIEQACRAIDRRGIKVLRTSSIYETAPMYKTDQASFLNGVCEVWRMPLTQPWRTTAADKVQGRDDAFASPNAGSTQSYRRLTWPCKNR